MTVSDAWVARSLLCSLVIVNPLPTLDPTGKNFSQAKDARFGQAKLSNPATVFGTPQIYIGP